MKIHHYFHHNSLRNFSYLIENNNRECLIIDPFDAAHWLEFVKKQDLKIRAIFFTHDHHDHYLGEKDFDKSILRIAFKNSILPFHFHPVIDGDIILENLTKDYTNLHFVINKTPGHTANHTALQIVQDQKITAIFTGDCLFNAGIGNVKNGGNLDDMFKTIMRLKNQLTNDTIMYPGHDYYLRNIEFNISILDKHNIALELLTSIKNKLANDSYDFTSMKTEFETNPFLKTEDFEQFKTIRELRNNW